VEVHSPFPIHGIEETMGLRDTLLPLATLAGGLAGGLGKLLFQSWVHVVNWPLNVGGKPDLALPALIPVTFELTVLSAAFATLFALLVRRRLYPRLHPDGIAHQQPIPEITDDRFVVLVAERDGRFSAPAFRDLTARLAPREVLMAWRVS
jgi:membrane protein implicated in regulation of membrane protease activity